MVLCLMRGAVVAIRAVLLGAVVVVVLVRVPALVVAVPLLHVLAGGAVCAMVSRKALRGLIISLGMILMASTTSCRDRLVDSAASFHHLAAMNVFWCRAWPTPAQRSAVVARAYVV